MQSLPTEHFDFAYALAASPHDNTARKQLPRIGDRMLKFGSESVLPGRARSKCVWRLTVA